MLVLVWLASIFLANWQATRRNPDAGQEMARSGILMFGPRTPWVWRRMLSEVSFLEALIRATIALVGFAVTSGGVLAVMAFLSGRD